jgi:hypothetical protein
MSKPYEWTEEQIAAAIEKGNKRSTDDWIAAGVFRVGNKRDKHGKKAEASDLRELMATLVKRSFAFNNREDLNHKDYKISFNWIEKDRLVKKIEIPRFFSEGLLFSPAILSLFEKTPLSRLPDSREQKYLLEVCCYRWQVIHRSLVVLDKTGEIGLDPSIDKHVDKDLKKVILTFANEFACMYKAFEIGWDEISIHYPDCSDHNALYIATFAKRLRTEFEDCINPPIFKLRTDIKRFKAMGCIDQLMLDILEKTPEISPQELREIISNNQSFEGISDLAHKGYGRLDEMSPWLKEYEEKITFVTGILVKSSNPEIHKVTWDWIRARRKSFDIAMWFYRREIDKKTQPRKIV